MFVTLIGISPKGKRKVLDFGSKWDIIAGSKYVLFSEKEGPWLFIIPCSNNDANKSRWIHLNDDENFKVVNITKE